jgi:opacity protein-like surface antigen
MNHTEKSRSPNNDAVSGHRAVLIAAMLCAALTTASAAMGQALPTAARVGDLQLGGSFVLGKSTNSQAIPSAQLTLPGFGLYGVFDNREHFGFEGNFRQINNPGGSQISERTYQAGGRYVLHFDRYIFNPYAKLLYGRGVYNYPGNVATLAYNMYTAGAGADLRLSYSFNLRVDYEYQTWMNFPRGDLHPNVLSVGVAYHFPQDCRTHICPK